MALATAHSTPAVPLRIPDGATIVVGHDGSPASAAAAHWALEHAHPHAHVVLVSLVGGGLDTPAWMEVDDVLDEEDDLLVAGGNPAPTLARIAEEHDADLIVVGHRPRHPSEIRPSLGHALLDLTHRPVLILS